MDKDRPVPVPALPSATIVLLRDGPGGPEMLLVRRRAGDAFGDSYAFPGGVVDADESAAREFCGGLTTAEANAALQVPVNGLDYYSSAIRELFEETGVLLARAASGEWAGANPAFRELRKQVDEGVLAWAEFLRKHDLVMACDALHYFAHWETPLRAPKRWSARFFVAEMPAGQDAHHDSHELTDSRWLSAADALSTARDGEIKLPFPTARNLEILSKFSSVNELIRWASRRPRYGVDKIRPVLVKLDGKTKFVIPGDPDYPKGWDQ